MGIKTEYECDLSGTKGYNKNDFVTFYIERDGEMSTVVVHESVLKDAMDEEETLSKIVLRDSDD